MAEYRDDEILYIPEGTTTLIDTNQWLNNNEKNNIKKIVMPKTLKKICVKSLAKFINVEEIILNDGLTVIEKFAFLDCKKLKQITIPKSIVDISNGIFIGCTSLEKIVVENNNPFYHDMGCNCIYDKFKSAVVAGCKTTTIPDCAYSIRSHAFSHNTELREIHIPESVARIDESAFFGCSGLRNKSIHYLTSVGHLNDDLLSGAVIHFEEQEILLGDILGYTNSINGLVFKTKDGNYHFADKDLNLVCISNEEFNKMATSHNKLEFFKHAEMYKLYEWKNYDNIPHCIVIEKMPIAEIPNFYLNNNRKNWQSLMKYVKFKTDVAIETVFTLAHALGVFSTDGKESKIATEYIATNLLSNYKIDELHTLVGDFNHEIKYNPEFAKFFMHNFCGLDFLQYTIPEADERISLVGACHNGFEKIQKAYPEKKVITRHRSECLTPELVLKILTHKNYENVDERAIELAEKVGLYGYTQYQFDLLQEWYLQGLKEKCVFSPQKDGDFPITFEVLEKRDPLGAVIGTITNCCQVAGGVGSHCVEYGMTQPNSTFIAFRAGARIVGQAWIWYDEKNKQITLDNIEIPHTALDDIYKGTISGKEFLQCLKRLAVALKDDFSKNRHPINNITIGLGYNDFKEFLVNNFKKVEKPQLLSDYKFYTDARQQVALLQPAMVTENDFCNVTER